jgi:hypothetical protein
VAAEGNFYQSLLVSGNGKRLAGLAQKKGLVIITARCERV